MPKFLVIFIFLCYFSGTALAVEPFFKGEWNMKPEEIRALLDTPCEEQPLLRALGYDYVIFGETVRVWYTFDETDSLCYIIAKTPLVIKESPANLHEFIIQMSDVITAQEQMEFIYFEKPVTEKTKSFNAGWINDKTYIKCHGIVPFNGGNITLNWAFYRNNGESHRVEFERLKARAKAGTGLQK